jgi:hypothetical protein
MSQLPELDSSIEIYAGYGQDSKVFVVVGKHCLVSLHTYT